MFTLQSRVVFFNREAIYHFWNHAVKLTLFSLYIRMLLTLIVLGTTVTPNLHRTHAIRIMLYADLSASR